jgi:hypothetical protein
MIEVNGALIERRRQSGSGSLLPLGRYAGYRALALL